MEMRSAAWGSHGGGAFPCRSGSNVRVDRKSSLQEIINFQCRQHAYRRLHEFAFLRARDSTLHSTSAYRRIICLLWYQPFYTYTYNDAKLTSHSFCSWNNPVLQTSSSRYRLFWCGGAYPLSFRQATLFFPFRVVTSTYKAKIDLAVPAWPSPLIIVKCTINLGYGLLVL